MASGILVMPFTRDLSLGPLCLDRAWLLWMNSTQLSSPFTTLPGIPDVPLLFCSSFLHPMLTFLWDCSYFGVKHRCRFLWPSMPEIAWLVLGLRIAFYVDHFPSESCRHWLLCWLIFSVAFVLSRAIWSLIIYVLPGLDFIFVFCPSTAYRIFFLSLRFLRFHSKSLRVTWFSSIVLKAFGSQLSDILSLLYF